LSLRYLMELVQIATNLKTHQEDFAVSKWTLDYFKAIYHMFTSYSRAHL
jgi:hypothetical protein